MKNKYHNHNSTLLDPEPLLSYVSPDGMWAIVPAGKKFALIHHGKIIDYGRSFQSTQNKMLRYQKPMKKVSQSKRNALSDALQ